MMKTIGSAPEVVSEIIAVAIEYDLHREPNQFINYMDLYSRYLADRRDKNPVSDSAAASFYEFVTSQTLLDSAALATETETGEALVPPPTLQATSKSLPDDVPEKPSGEIRA